MPVPALRSFCWQVAILLFFNIIGIITLFPAMMAIDLARRRHKRIDVLCCIKVNKDKIQPTQKNGGNANKKPPPKIFVERGELRRPGPNQTDSNQTAMESPIETGNSPPSYEQAIFNQPQQMANSNNNNTNTNTNNNNNNNNDPKFQLNGKALNENSVDTKPSLDRLVSVIHESANCSETMGCERFLEYFVNHVYAPFLGRMPVKVLVLLFFTLLMGIGVIGMTQLTLGLELTDVVPTGTAPYDFLLARQQYFSFYPMNGIVRGKFLLQFRFYFYFQSFMLISEKIF